MELEINCKDCIKYTAPEDPSHGFGFCRQYNTEVPVDKFLNSCPGARRREGAPKARPKLDPMDILEGQAEQINDLQNAVHGIGVRQDTMEDKIDSIIEALSAPQGGDKVDTTKSSGGPAKSETSPPGPAKAAVKKVTKKKAAKKP